MFKISKYILGALLACSTVSCSDFLNRMPSDILLPDQIFKDQAGIEAYFATIYAQTPIEDFNFQNGNFNSFPGRGESNPSCWAGEINGEKDHNMDACWEPSFKAIRMINDMLQTLETLTIINETERKELISEARCLRGLSYLFLVRIWGGVPIFEKPLDYNAPTDELMVPRNKEKEVWDFIIKDFEYAAENGSSAIVYGRVNRYAALGFLSRAALYAGSIAKYGHLDESYCIGIDPSFAEGYYKLAKKAAFELIESHKYSLYDKYPSDKVKNFNSLFLDTKGNPEVLFVKGFDYESTKHTHSYDGTILPRQLVHTSGTYFTPYLETIEQFEFVNGNPAAPIVGPKDGAYATYKTLEAAFAGRDPRLYASILLPNTEAKGVLITIQSGVWEKGAGKTNPINNMFYDTVKKEFVPQQNENTVRGTGESGGVGSSSDCKTAFCARKYMDESRPAELCDGWESDTDWIVLRLAEVYLNYVEAAIETGTDLDIALGYINEVKRRAGVKEFETTAELQMDRYRAERRSEFLFENLTYWDHKRWKVLTEMYKMDTEKATHQRSRMYIYYDYENDEYVLRKNAFRTYTPVDDRVYYSAIPSAELAKNKHFVNNPYY